MLLGEEVERWCECDEGHEVDWRDESGKQCADVSRFQWLSQDGQAVRSGMWRIVVAVRPNGEWPYSSSLSQHVLGRPTWRMWRPSAGPGIVAHLNTGVIKRFPLTRTTQRTRTCRILWTRGVIVRHLARIRGRWLSCSGFGPRMWMLLCVLMVEVGGWDGEDDAAALHL